MSKNDEKYDGRISEDAPWGRILSKHFVRPHQTPEARLAALLDSGKPFEYKDTLFYKIRSGKMDPWIATMPVAAKWWDMPWLRSKDRKRKGHKKHEYMLRLLRGFKSIFYSIKQNGFNVNDFRSRIRCDKLQRGSEICYIYVDANKRMGILGYFVASGQIKIETIPVKIARSAASSECSWMPDEKAIKLFNHPFEVLKK